MDRLEENDHGNREFGWFSSKVYSFFAERSKKHKEIYEKIAVDIEKREPKRILDVGCGPGIAISILARTLPNSNFYGLDTSPTMIGIAKKRLEKAGLSNNTSFEVGSSSRVPFNGEFDCIFSSLSFHHWSNREKTLEGILERLSDRGILLIYENFVDDPQEPMDPSKTHGISSEYAERLNFKGFEKQIEIYGRTIVLKFVKIT